MRGTLAASFAMLFFQLGERRLTGQISTTKKACASKTSVGTSHRKTTLILWSQRTKSIWTLPDITKRMINLCLRKSRIFENCRNNFSKLYIRISYSKQILCFRFLHAGGNENIMFSTCETYKKRGPYPQRYRHYQAPGTDLFVHRLPLES